MTPAVAVNDDWLLGYEQKFAQAGRELKGGSRARRRKRVPGVPRRHPPLQSRIASREHEHLAYQFRIIDGERHAGMQLESYTRGLRFVFAPLAPESGPATRPWSPPITTVRTPATILSQPMGCAKVSPERC